jgi:hypothetical protein
MKTLTVKIQNYSDLSNLSINDVCCSIDSNGMRHSNQYLQPNGRLYSYKDYVNYLVKRFKYEQVTLLQNNISKIIWTKKIN